MLATSYHNVNMPKRQTLFNPECTKEHEFISKSFIFMDFCTLYRCEVRSYKNIKVKNMKLNLLNFYLASFARIFLKSNLNTELSKST